ncbi:MAG TPA: VOC family protein [Pyrinomonadaceae bacterium]|nr:VOC family protein [Pyrinomonadaceae bacterium]
MPIGIVQLDHVNVVVSKSLEAAAKEFYGSILGLKEIPKPVELQGRGGAWYQLGSVQLHLSAKADATAEPRKGHVCYTVARVGFAEEQLRAAGIEIIPDDQPMPGKPRFYVRDPGGNLIELAQSV